MNLLARASKGANRTLTRGRVSLRAYFIERLAGLEAQRRDAVDTLDNQQRRLLDHVLYSTYWDCVELGMRDDALRLLGMEAVVEP
jgi:hypothetical protein